MIDSLMGIGRVREKLRELDGYLLSSGATGGAGFLGKAVDPLEGGALHPQRRVA